MRRNNQLSTNEVDFIMDSVTKEEIDFEEALKLFLEDCEIRNLRAHTTKYYKNELSAFYKILREQEIDPAPHKIRNEHINVTEHIISDLNFHINPVQNLK